MPMKPKLIDVALERCTGCRSCELVCSFHKEGEFNLAKARIRVIINDALSLSIPTLCMQCVDAPCIRVCPTTALRRHATTGAVVVEDRLCIGCRMCSLACPFGAMHFHSAKTTAFKCDLCGGDPQCVRVCAPQALRFVEREAVGSVQLRKVTDRLSQQILSGSHPAA
jgi:carbon-monoxide dehydrogenase iron sulfur subunit